MDRDKKNISIALFLGWEQYTGSNVFKRNDSMGTPIHLNDMRFHCSLDWISPVLKKIEEHDNKIIIMTDRKVWSAVIKSKDGTYDSQLYFFESLEDLLYEAVYLYAYSYNIKNGIHGA